MNMAVIPARGGSKRIPRKNIKEFAGKPMLAWAILAAKAAGVFERILVSTDSEEIAATALSWGAEVPFMRPETLADDHTPTAPVILHAITELIASGAVPTYACCIYPTAPFLQADDLRHGLQLMRASNAPAAISVTSFDFPILRAFRECPDGSLAFNWPEHEMTRSQDLPDFFHDAGQFCWVDVTRFMAEKRMIMPGTIPVKLPRKRVQDVDTPEDWEAAELMAKVLLPKENFL
jgi:pseudaminic acid cytidylyltransferase